MEKVFKTTLISHRNTDNHSNINKFIDEVNDLTNKKIGKDIVYVNYLHDPKVSIEFMQENMNREKRFSKRRIDQDLHDPTQLACTLTKIIGKALEEQNLSSLIRVDASFDKGKSKIYLYSNL